MAYAHALIELEDGTRFKRGAEVPDDLPDIDALRDGGAVSDEPYDPESDKLPAPEEVVINGVVYKKASDGAATEDEADAG